MASAYDRVLVEIVTIAQLAGVEAAKSSFLGLNPATVALAATLGILIKVGKDALDNYKAQETASLDLAQAYATQKDSLENHRQELETFLQTNKDFIADQYDTQAALANVVRAGLNPGSEAFRVLNDALDLAVIKHESVSEAARTLILAEAGNARGLRDLGITTAEYNAIMKSTLSDADKHAALLALVEQKTKDGRNATDNLSKAQHDLNTDWQNFTVKIAPDVAAGLDQIYIAADRAVQILTLVSEALDKIARNQGAIDFLLGKPGAGRGANWQDFLSGVPGSLHPLLNQSSGLAAAGSASQSSQSQALANQLRIEGAFNP